MRVVINHNPFPPASMPGYWQPPAEGRCRWIWHPHAPDGAAAVLAFRLPFCVNAQQTTRLHVSADQRYELFLDGKRLGRGPLRGDVRHWYFETYDVSLAAGKHLLAARVWWLPEDGPPMAQLSAAPGFLLHAEGPLSDALSTGIADWQVTAIQAYEGERSMLAGYHVIGWAFNVDGGHMPWGWERDPQAPGEWVAAAPGESPIGPGHPYFETETRTRNPQHHLIPAPLPAMLEETRQVGRVRFASRSIDPEGFVAPEQHDGALAARWQALLHGGAPLVIPPGQTMRILIDLENYYCGYPELVVSGGSGAHARIGWAEGLFASSNPRDSVKGNRDVVEGKYMRGFYDSFVFEGGSDRCYDILWWRAGRYLDCQIETADEALTLSSLVVRETRYPLEWDGELRTSDPALDRALPILYRALQMCSHETYMDCPYYEQLMYVGDTRLEVLVTYLTSRDDRLPLQALQLFDWSRGADGLTKSRYPTAVPQVIPPFSLWWVSMVHDLFMWRDRQDLVRSLLPGVHTVLAAFEQRIGPRGLVEGLDGWNFVDWVPEWNAGWAPGPPGGPNAPVNLQYVYALDRAVEMLRYTGQDSLAQHWEGVGQRVREAILRVFWDAKRGLLADDPEHAHYSEHSQCLAILADLMHGEVRARTVHGLLHEPNLARATIYFSHYLLEALYHLDAMDAFAQKLAFWKALPDLGLYTTLEAPEPSRSDCHAWGAHPIYHAYHSLLGAQPAEPGFRRIRIAPRPGPFTALAGRFPHPAGGDVVFDVRFDQGAMAGEITLPGALHGELIWQGEVHPLLPGANVVELGK